MKLIAVDVGNTSTAVGLWSGGRVSRVSHIDGPAEAACAAIGGLAASTGKIDGVFPAGNGKLFYFGVLCGRHNVLPQNCAAYGDSINDAPLLEACGEAHAVSPSEDLKKLAAAKNWIIDEWRA